MQHGADISAFQFLLLVCVAEERERDAVCAEGRLHAIRNEFLVGVRIKIFKVLAAVVGVALEVEIRTVGDAPEFAPAEWSYNFV